MNESEDKSVFNCRNLLKTSLAASVAASTMSAAAAWEGSPAALPAVAGSETARPFIIRVAGKQSTSPWESLGKNCIAVDLPATLLRADLQSRLARLQREIGYRPIGPTHSSTKIWPWLRAARMGGWRFARSRGTRA